MVTRMRAQLSRVWERWRGLTKWLLGGLLVVAIGALLFSLSLANVTAQGSAERTLRHSVAILTEIDAYLDDHFETLRREAQQTEESSVDLPDFPIALSFPPDEIADADRAQFRALLLDRAATLLHEEGVSLLQEDREAEVSFFSPQGALRSGMDFLRPTPNRALTAATIALAALAFVLALALAAATRGYGRLLALGLSILMAAAPFVVFAVAVRFAFRLAADGVDDYLAREFLELGQELTWAPIRNGIIFATGGGLALLAGAMLARWADSRRRL